MELFELIAQAIARQENDPTGMYGVRSVSTAEPSKVLMNSVKNNYRRWENGDTPAPWINERPAKFIDFMQRRWAPIGAENDPRNLNANWAPGVRAILRQMIGDQEYERLRRLNIVMEPNQTTYA